MTFYPETISLRLSYPKFKISDRFPFHIKPAFIRSHFPAHRHDYLECSLVLEGEGYQLINGRRYEMRPGNFFFLLPDQIHEMYKTSSIPLKLLNCMFDIRFLFLSSGIDSGLEPLLQAGQELSPSICVSGRDFEIFCDIMWEMVHEYEQAKQWRKHLLLTKLSELLIRFDRLRKQGAEPVISEGKAGTASIWSIVRHIHLHYHEPITLSEIADNFGVSVSLLSREFKKHVGVGFVQFLHDLRVRHACSLLVSTEMSGMEVAEEVGFGSLRTFFRTFRELKGMTPLDYRKRFHLREDGAEEMEESRVLKE